MLLITFSANQCVGQYNYLCKILRLFQAMLGDNFLFLFNGKCNAPLPRLNRFILSFEIAFYQKKIKIS